MIVVNKYSTPWCIYWKTWGFGHTFSCQSCNFPGARFLQFSLYSTNTLLNQSYFLPPILHFYLCTWFFQFYQYEYLLLFSPCIRYSDPQVGSVRFLSGFNLSVNWSQFNHRVVVIVSADIPKFKFTNSMRVSPTNYQFKYLYIFINNLLFLIFII